MRKIHRESLDRFKADLVQRGARSIQRDAWTRMAQSFLEGLSTMRTSKVIYSMTSGDLRAITGAAPGHPLYDFLAGCIQDEIDLRIPTPPSPIEP